MITGPIASGKSTLAAEVAELLEHRGVPAAVIDLDVVHDTVVASGSTRDDAAWTLARAEAAAQANTLHDAGVSVVIAEGSFNTPSDREAFSRHLRAELAPVYVTLRVTYDEALRRAQLDPTRGMSRDPAFLRSTFAKRREAFTVSPATDLVIDTEQTTVAIAAQAVSDLVTPGSRRPAGSA